VDLALGRPVGCSGGFPPTVLFTGLLMGHEQVGEWRSGNDRMNDLVNRRGTAIELPSEYPGDVY